MSLDPEDLVHGQCGVGGNDVNVVLSLCPLGAEPDLVSHKKEHTD